MRKIDNINPEYLHLGIVFIDNYCAPYIWSDMHLNCVIQAFSPLMDNLQKIDLLIEDSKKLKTGNKYGNCIGENETLISFKDGYYQFYSVVLSDDVYLEIEQSAWLILLASIKDFMVNNREKIYKCHF